MRLSSLALLTLIGCTGTAEPDPSDDGTDTDPPLITFDTDDSTTEDTSSTDTDYTPTVTDANWFRADDASPGTMQGGADMAIAPDGSLLVSWVGTDDDIHLVRSTDGGASFSASVVVDGPEDPIVDWWSGPALSTDGTSIILVSPARDDVGLRGYVWRGDLNTLTFQPGQWYGDGLVEMIAAGLAPDGDLWVSWLEYDGGAQVMLANSTLGYGGTNVNNALGTPSCECCHIDLMFSSDAKPLLAWRDNDMNIRNIAVASGAPGAQSVANQVVATNTDWLTFTCPVQGPKIAQTQDGNYLVAWSDDSTGSSKVWTVSSSDFVNWSEESDVAPDQPGRVQSPRVVVADSGRVYLAFAQPGSYWIQYSDDHGASWSAPEEQEIGGLPVDRLDIAAGAGQLWLEGESNGQVWIKQLE